MERILYPVMYDVKSDVKPTKSNETSEGHATRFNM